MSWFGWLLSWFVRPAAVVVKSVIKTRTGRRLTGAVLIVALTSIGGYEGLRLNAYRDSVGVPTICYGETRGVRIGDKKTKAQCDSMFITRLSEFEGWIRGCIDRPDSIPDTSYIAFLSLSYNIGNGAFCKSTLVKRLNAGDLRGACNEILRWNKAGGKVLRGLVIRRNVEHKDCLKMAWL